MSYILEALKKSQQERELGQVPTLEAAPRSDPRRAARTGPWGLVAVGLAGLALAVALYAALHRTGPAAPGAGPVPAASVPQPAAQADGPPPLPTQPSVPQPPMLESPMPEPGPQIAAVPVVPLAAPVPVYPEGPEPFQGMEGPGPRPDSPVPPDAVLRGDVPPLAQVEEEESLPDPMDEPDTEAWTEMDEEVRPAAPAVDRPRPAPEAAPQRRARPARPTLPPPSAPPIPEDLRKDVAAFRDELQRERGGAPPRPAAAKAAPEDLTKLRLPLDIEGRAPAFFLTAHIYDKAADKRFVVINALKYVQGESTREGLKVEEILPDGVVLSFEGHRFYRRR